MALWAPSTPLIFHDYFFCAVICAIYIHGFIVINKSCVFHPLRAPDTLICYGEKLLRIRVKCWMTPLVKCSRERCRQDEDAAPHASCTSSFLLMSTKEEAGHCAQTLDVVTSYMTVRTATSLRGCKSCCQGKPYRFVR